MSYGSDQSKDYLESEWKLFGKLFSFDRLASSFIHSFILGNKKSWMIINKMIQFIIGSGLFCMSTSWLAGWLAGWWLLKVKVSAFTLSVLNENGKVLHWSIVSWLQVIYDQSALTEVLIKVWLRVWSFNSKESIKDSQTVKNALKQAKQILV